MIWGNEQIVYKSVMESLNVNKEKDVKIIDIRKAECYNVKNFKQRGKHACISICSDVMGTTI